MADKDVYLSVFLTVFVVLLKNCSCMEQVIEYHEDKRPCTYFARTRSASYEPGLVNCSWYVSNSCCKRTEVTSVFSSNKMSLYRASDDCRNQLNYLMCFFCSPDQDQWYKDGKVHVCEKFCKSMYADCRDAYYKGSRIGEHYGNGTAFCEAQNFHVVNSKNCFKFDPTVFDTGTNACVSLVLILVSFCFVKMVRLFMVNQ